MRLILAIEPDRKQANQLTTIVRGRLHAELVLADSAEKAFAALGERIPDLILSSALLSPADESVLAERLRALEATHVHNLTIPVFASRSGGDGGGVLSALRRGKSKGAAPDGCDPAFFAEQCSEYLEQTETERRMNAQYDDPIEEPLAQPPVAQAAVAESAAEPTSEWTEPVTDLPIAAAPLVEEPIVEPSVVIDAPAHIAAEVVSEPVAQVATKSVSTPASPLFNKPKAAAKVQEAIARFEAFTEEEPTSVSARAPEPVRAQAKQADDLDEFIELDLSKMLDEDVPAVEPVKAAPAASAIVKPGPAKAAPAKPAGRKGPVKSAGLRAAMANRQTPPKPEPAHEPDDFDINAMLKAASAKAPARPLRDKPKNGATAKDREETLTPTVPPPAPAPAVTQRSAVARPAVTLAQRAAAAGTSQRPAAASPQRPAAPLLQRPAAPIAQKPSPLAQRPAPAAPQRAAVTPQRPIAPAVEQPKEEATTADTAASKNGNGAKRPKNKPAQDEWGLYDPEQCGLAALFEKLDEIDEDTEADQKVTPRRRA